MIITEPMPFRSLRGIMASIQVHEEMLKQVPDGLEEAWRIQRALALLGQQLDEAEKLWKAHHAKA
jgi:hypothetical protein